MIPKHGQYVKYVKGTENENKKLGVFCCGDNSGFISRRGWTDIDVVGTALKFSFWGFFCLVLVYASGVCEFHRLLDFL
ncbi:MAG: hypothetical protein PHQ35_07585 [Phycisphaerae bacterium]|nr:hypothetical protein [Phycisphaerae bacterium]MDD5380023.1 hypothetical protein [Phycisphaerae bacterium]